MRIGVLTLTMLLCACQSRQGKLEHWGKEKNNPGGYFHHQLITGNVAPDGREGWDRFYNTRVFAHGQGPSRFLQEIMGHLQVGRALVLAMGEGTNAVYLARMGFKVDGVDISQVALRRARMLAKKNGVKVNAVNANLKHYSIRPNYYDVIVNFTYFRHGIIQHIKDRLKPGGVVVFQNYLTEHLGKPGGTSVPKRFLVKKGELKGLFQDFNVIRYSETVNQTEAVARLVAQKAST